MKPISVVIATANRPLFLETALGSVARQTAVNEIEEVIVSENLGNRASEKVCAKFKSLPIKYIFRDPPMTLVQHGVDLYKTAKSEFVAVLHDDDWWCSGHLQTALSTLKSVPDAAAYFSASVFVKSEDDVNGHIFKHPVIRLAAGAPEYTVPWRLNSAHIFALTWLYTPFHLSSTLVRREILLRQADELLKANPWYSDSVFYAGLSRYGTALYNPFVEVFVRRHDRNWDSGKSKSYLNSVCLEGSEKILALSKNSGFDIIAIWKEYFAKAPEDTRRQIAELFLSRFGKEMVCHYGLGSFMTGMPKDSVYAAIKRTFKLFMPPILLELYQKIFENRKEHC